MRNRLILRMLLARLGLGIVTLLVVSMLIFALTNTLPGDFATGILGRDATPEALTALRRTLGFDRPPYVRYFLWLFELLHGNLGVSLTSQTGDVRTVASIIAPRLRNTILLAGLTAVIAIPLAVSIGILSATYRNSRPTGQFGWSR
jgi:peptide/nickel transport system permease protein